jgi:histidinol-phosphate aminotransferase
VDADKLTMVDWSSLVRPSLVGLKPYRPGPSLSELRREHGLDEIAKLNWNEDLFGPLPGALDAVKDELVNAWMYPEQAYSDLREAVAGWLELPPEAIVPAHGIQALIAAVAHTFIREGDAVVVPQPTYGLYAQVSAGAGAHIVPVPNRDYRLDLAALADTARTESAKLVWICDPNNPTGSLVEPAEWTEFLAALPDGAVAVVDEAYREYADPERRVDREPDVLAGRPLVLLRTFSKIFGLAGLRLGYAVAHPELAPYLDVVQEPFNVNRAALAAGRACLAHPERIEERRRESSAARALLAQLLLAEAGVESLPSEANFLLVEVGGDDAALAGELVMRGFLVRPGSEFGLDGWIRVTVGPRPLMERFVAELAAVRDGVRR